MYEKFTQEARNVMMRANEEAKQLNHEYIGEEHILLGLMKRSCQSVCRVLYEAGE